MIYEIFFVENQVVKYKLIESMLVVLVDLFH